MVSVWVSGLGGMYLERADVWKAAGTRPTAGGRRLWCRKSRRQVSGLQPSIFFLGPLLYLMWPGGHMWVTLRRKNCRPAHLCLAVTTDMRILALLCSSHDVALSMAPMLMRTHPDPNHTSSSLPLRPGEPPHRQRHAMTSHDHPGCAPSSGRGPAPLTCPAPSQHIAAIPHASHMPFMCPSASHDLTHGPWPPSMHPDTFRHTSPLLDMPPPSQTHPACPSCAADQLQFLLTSDGMSYYFPSILLFQLFSSFVSCNCTSLLVNLTNITMTSL